MSNEENDNKEMIISFIANAINDTQEIIRAIDTKISILLLFLVIPFTHLGKIYQTVSKLLSSQHLQIINIGLWLMVFLFILCWLFSFLIAIRAIIAIDNPARHINRDKKLFGIFYSGGLYNLCLCDTLRNRLVVSSASFEVHKEKYPTTFEEIKAELIFEHMKVSYIRDIKMFRQKWAYLLAIVWFIIGGILWFISLL